MANNESYSRQLSSGIGTGWNRFWFTPRDTMGVALLRVLVGLMAL